MACATGAGKAAFGAPCEVSSCPDAYYQEERGMYCNQWHSCQWVDMVSATGLTTMTIDHVRTCPAMNAHAVPPSHARAP